MKYDVLIQAVSQGHITVEAASPEEAKAAAMHDNCMSKQITNKK